MPAKPARAASPKRFVIHYSYCGPDGREAYQVQRAEINTNGKRDKMISVRHRDASGKWVWKKPNVDYPYRLPELLAAPEGTTVYIVEGENKVEAIRERGGLATCNQGGAGDGKFKAEWAEWFKGKFVVLLPDNDDPGKAHMARIWEILKRVVNGISYHELPGLGEKEDVIDYFAAGKSMDDLRKYVSDALCGLIEAKVTPFDHGDAYEPPQDRRRVTPRKRSIGLMLNEVTREEIKWLWRGRIPIGSITMLDGDPGCGKSNVAHYLAACVSAGLNFPDGDCFRESGVILIDVENGPTTTTLPRIENNGGRLDRVKLITTIPTSDGKSERLFSFPEDLDILAEQVEEMDARLVIVDTIMNHLGGDVQSRNDQDVRRALTPLSQLAAKLGFAVLILRHLNKSSIGPALYRGAGSIGFIGVARVGLIVGNDPDSPQAKILAVSKINDWKKMPSLKYQIRSHPNGSSFVEWLGESDHDADGVLAAPATDDEKTVVEEGGDVLRELLANGGMDQKEIERHAKDAGVSWASIRRAKAILGVVAYREGGFGEKGKWRWCLKEHVGTDLQTPKAPIPEGVDTIEPQQAEAG